MQLRFKLPFTSTARRGALSLGGSLGPTLCTQRTLPLALAPWPVQPSQFSLISSS